MSTIDVTRSLEDLTLTFTTELDASIERAWRLWEDPRQLERWWGPPTYPATFVDHDLRPGGHASYYMTGPDGDQPRGWWRILEVQVPRWLRFEDGFSDGDGRPDPSLPTTTTEVTLEPLGADRTTMRIRASFPSLDAMQRLLDMGMEEGLAAALGQTHGILAEG